MYQKVTLVGHLGKDPDMRYTPSGQAVTNFSMATSRKWTGADGSKNEETCWWRISVWGKPAESTNLYLHKGSKVLVEGTMIPDPKTGGPKIWTGRDGTAGSSFEVNAREVRFLDSKGDSEKLAGDMQYAEGAAAGGTPEADIPF